MTGHPPRPTAGLVAALVVLGALAPRPLAAQGGRVDLGYAVRGYGLSTEPGPGGGGGASPLVKGHLRAGYTRYPTRHLFASLGGTYLLHDDGPFMGGPLRFDAVHAGARLGLQWGGFALFGLARGGRLSGLRVRATGPDGGRRWVEPAGDDARWSASAGGGVAYHPMALIEARVEVTRPVAAPGTVEPAAAAAAAPAVGSAELSSSSLSVSLSISVPFGRPRPMATPHPTSAEVGGGGPGPGARRRSRGVTFVDPLPGPSVITSPYGGRRGHEGVDVDTEPGDPVRAAARGRVVRAGRASGFGRMVELRHGGGYTTLYAHLREIVVAVGDDVEPGQRIGSAGRSGEATGSHLHFELRLDGRPIDPVGVVPIR